MSADRDPTKQVDGWPISGLSENDRKKIKAELHKAHAVFLRAGPYDAYGFIAPMVQAFSRTAGILFDANILTVEILENTLERFVIESAIAGGWLYFAERFDSAQTIFAYFKEKLPRIFLAEIADWKGKLLEREASESASTPETKAMGRRTFIMPLLAEKGWSVFDWATEAEVSHATAMDYLNNKTKPHPSSLRKLAKALGISVEAMPK